MATLAAGVQDRTVRGASYAYNASTGEYSWPPSAAAAQSHNTGAPTFTMGQLFDSLMSQQQAASPAKSPVRRVAASSTRVTASPTRVSQPARVITLADQGYEQPRAAAAATSQYASAAPPQVRYESASSPGAAVPPQIRHERLPAQPLTRYEPRQWSAPGGVAAGAAGGAAGQQAYYPPIAAPPVEGGLYVCVGGQLVPMASKQDVSEFVFKYEGGRFVATAKEEKKEAPKEEKKEKPSTAIRVLLDGSCVYADDGRPAPRSFGYGEEESESESEASSPSRPASPIKKPKPKPKPVVKKCECAPVRGRGAPKPPEPEYAKVIRVKGPVKTEEVKTILVKDFADA